MYFDLPSLSRNLERKKEERKKDVDRDQIRNESNNDPPRDVAEIPCRDTAKSKVREEDRELRDLDLAAK